MYWCVADISAAVASFAGNGLVHDAAVAAAGFPTMQETKQHAAPDG